MKLRNKKTGEIATVEGFGSTESEIQMTYTIDNDETKLYLYCTSSLATFNEEWEDYEEPKGYWYINELGTPTEVTHTRENIYDKQRKGFGNYFETKKEAEKAVEKLKAWKRLKENSWKPVHYNIATREASVIFSTGYTITEQDRKDLDLLFGGEE